MATDGTRDLIEYRARVILELTTRQMSRLDSLCLYMLSSAGGLT